jgi:hypothetical protein
MIVPDPNAASPHDALPNAQSLAATEALWRVVRGEKVPPETLAMLRTLRLSALEEILSDGDGEPRRDEPT